MKRILYLMLLSLAIVSCESNEDSNGGGDTAASVTCSVSELTVPYDGGTYQMTVSTTLSSWVTYPDDNSSFWITVSATGAATSSGTVTVVVGQNTSAVKRTGHVIIKSGTTKLTIPVIQSAQAWEPDNTITVPSGYELVWHDEFDEGTSPNTSMWWYETGNNGWGNNELQNYVTGNNHPQVCSVADGFLSITARKSGSEVQSIRMNTSEAWQYGWFEARLKLTSGKGTWPAFWMMPKNFTSWPGDGEIDIMEEVGYDPNRIYSTIHCTAYNGGAGTQKGGSIYVGTAQTDFHVYALEWTPQYIRGMVDGQEYFRYTETGSHQTWPFDAPFYLKLNLAWGGNWGGAQGIDESALPATYKIDYVRVYQKK